VTDALDNLETHSLRRGASDVRALALTGITLGLVLGVASTVRAGDQPADLVVLNGKLWTGDAASSMAKAVAIRDGVVVQVGSSAEARKLAGDTTRVIDAAGKRVIPGLIESHVHATGAARAELIEPFVQLGSIAEIQQWVRAKAEKTPVGSWIRIPRVDTTRILERRLPTRGELDQAAPNHPVVFNWQYANRQIQILNTAALRGAGITRDTANPPRGKIVKDPDGEPTGRLEDSGGLVAKFLPSKTVSDDEFLRSLEHLLHSYNAIGITSIFERNSNVAGYRAYETLKKQGRLTVRATVTIGLGSDGTIAGTERFIQTLPFRFGHGDDWVRVGPLKIFVDGGALYGTAYMREPFGPRAASFYGYSDPDYRGELSKSPEQITNMIRTGHRLGWQLSSHVTGDAGVDVVLDAVEAANQDQPIRGRRYTLIHAYFPQPEAIRRAAALGVCVDTQPAWYYKDGDTLASILGEQRLARFIGLRDWTHGGVMVAINSDHMYGFDPNSSLNPYNPFLAMGTAVTRRTERGQVFGLQQRVAPEDALRMMTAHAAYLSFDEARKGSIEVGKLGDLAILDEDLLTCPADRIKDIRVALTIVGGKVVYEARSER
jgi:predicted amidohydrolase YtcJ